MIRVDAIVSTALYTEKETGPLIGRSLGWLRRGRWLRTGPAYIKQGRAVFYRGSDLIAWLEGGRVETAQVA